jgi:glucose/arabinose dehydrogenase
MLRSIRSAARFARHRPRLTFLPWAVVLAFVPGCGDGTTAPSTGSLTVTIEGLPAGVPSAVTVTGPSGYSAVVGSSSTLTALRSGTYIVVGADVTTGGVRYDPTPATQTIVVSSGALTTASSITYAVATARLAVTVLGLPTGAQAGVAVFGPNGYARTLTGTEHIDLLEPGAYTVTAGDVQATGKTYRPSPAMQNVTLTASATAASIVVAYGAGNAALDLTITGLPSGTNASVAVAGPGGFARTVTSSTTLPYLEAGRYTLSAAVVGSNLTTHVPSPASQTADVADAATSSASVTYGSAPLELSLELVADGLTAPVFLTAPDGDGRQFVVERQGRIRVIENGALLPTPFLDIGSRVNFTGERGLLGIAFDPQYATNGFFYAYYVNVSGDMTVERFGSTPGGNVAGGSAGVVMVIPHRGENHHGGLVAFGPDGMLYVAPGDGGCCGDPNNNAQSRNTLLGKMLRIDVRTTPYTVPPGNPFIGRTGMRPEIWAYGLRNPWRFSFDAPARRLYIADVGQDTREEVNVASTTAAGLNYGWRLMEGSACYNPSTGCNPGSQLKLPAHEYLHTEGCSVTGGYVYRGSAIPELTGHYLYSDYCRGWLRSFRVTTGGVATEHRLWAGITLPLAVSFGRDGAGELYMIGGTQVWRIVRRSG